MGPFRVLAVILNHRGDEAASDAPQCHVSAQWPLFLALPPLTGALRPHAFSALWRDAPITPGVPAVFQCSDGNAAQENSSLKRVAVVEDFFDIIYAMHVEMGADPGRAPKHAGQKKTYKAVSETHTHAHTHVLFSLCCPQLVRAVSTSVLSDRRTFARQ